MLLSLNKLKKLRRMPPGELLGRAAGHWGIQRLKRMARTPENWTGQVAGMEAEIAAACQTLVPGTRPDQRERLAREFPRELKMLCQSTERVAGRIAVGEYHLLGQPVRVDRPIDWHADPVSGHRWDDAFFSRVSYHRIPEHVDFKHIWELGRHQYLVELTRSGLLNGVESHLELARHVLESWLAQNRFGHGIHWTSGLEVAMRSMSWIWMIASAPSLLNDEALAKRWIGELFLHGHYLENHLSIYSSPYNHVIGEATGMYLLGAVFQGLPDADRWRNKGRDLLHGFGPRQFYDDGFCVEQAMGYHYFTLGFLTLAMVAGQAPGDTDLAISELVRKGYQAGLLFRQPDGRWPAIGDVDSASAIPVAREDFWDFAPLHQFAAAALNDPEIACVGQESFVESFWLLGIEGLKYLHSISVSESEARVAVLPHAGYFTACNASDSITFDAGPIAHGLHPDATPSAAHGHADTLQVLVHWAGRSVIRDSGMPNYAGNSMRRDHFRSPSAHSSIIFDGAPLVRAAGGLSWSHDIATTQLRWAKDTARWRACGSVKWDDCAITRHLLAIPGEAVWIADWLETAREQTAEWYWQLASRDWQLANTTPRCPMFESGPLTITTAVDGDRLEFELIGPDDEGCAAGSSPGYGVVERAAALRFQIPVGHSSLILTVIGSPRRSARFVAGETEVQLTSTDDSVELGHRASNCVEREYDSLGIGAWYLHE
ncbi:hypothetical protein FYK55_05165 [Roseiconus nitratireducens]|uniref:Uncharacterized protein n=1 Tax=Roseiconus nitratireducens TaxID=2605748 RepID=A0A5M6DFE9_9BACT|nr:heparinase II/III family protein [Roseiconus nitratireducens]KAA5546277.1 hypothetical protein FYK55_05165 [Roseiconus nitratireducens]